MGGDNVLFAFILTLVAGLSTGIGSAIAFFASHTNRKFLSFALGMSAGVMIYVSFVELLSQSQISLSELLGDKQGKIVSTVSFFGGMFIAAMIDKIVPSGDNPHEIRKVESMQRRPPRNKQKLMRTGVITAITIAVHNFPEGIATFMVALNSPEIGIAIAIAIAIHNIPEGIAVSVPVYYATGSRKKAFWYSFLSGLAEPIGALTAYFILMPYMSPFMLGCMFAGVAGIMVFISLDELLPAAEEYGEHHISIYGLVFGMAVMAVSLILLK